MHAWVGQSGRSEVLRAVVALMSSWSRGGAFRTTGGAPARAPDRAGGGPSHPRGAAVEFRHVTKQYGGVGKGGRGVVVAVDDLSLVVPPGEICVLVGPSGCGKSTTLKMVNRLVEPTSGQILVAGEDVTAVDVIDLRRRIGYVIQHVGLFPHQTVAENVATIPRLLGWRRDRIEERVDELLMLVGLDPARLRNRYPYQLSGGERQRVGVARALAAEPPLMLMDEPFGAVDPITRRHLQDEFLRLQRQLGTTILMVTHDVDEAVRMGDWLAIMGKGGRLVQYARPTDLLANPADEFVARFVGADRALKLLGLITLQEIELEEAPVVRDDEPVPEVLAHGRAGVHAVLVDGDRRPCGWLEIGRVGDAGGARVFPCPPPLPVDATVRNALTTLLMSPSQAAVVVDRAGRYVGVVTLDVVGNALRLAIPVDRSGADDRLTSVGHPILGPEERQ